MEFSLILFIIFVVVIIYLIFKFINKLVHAVFLTIFFFILVIVGIFGLAYLDYNYLVGQENYDLNFVLGSQDSYEIGLEVPVINGQVEFDRMSGLSKDNLEDLNPREIKSESGLFLITIKQSKFRDFIDSKESYNLATIVPSLSGEVDLELTSNELSDILFSDNPNQDFAEVISNKNDGAITENLILNQLDDLEQENNLDMRQVLFATVLVENIISESSALDIVEGFKSGEINIYPERFTFKLLKFIVPSGTIKSLIDNSLGNNNSSDIVE